jgi:hypothetical protein
MSRNRTCEGSNEVRRAFKKSINDEYEGSKREGTHKFESRFHAISGQRITTEDHLESWYLLSVLDPIVKNRLFRRYLANYCVQLRYRYSSRKCSRIVELAF